MLTLASIGFQKINKANTNVRLYLREALASSKDCRFMIFLFVLYVSLEILMSKIACDLHYVRYLMQIWREYEMCEVDLTGGWENM